MRRGNAPTFPMPASRNTPPPPTTAADWLQRGHHCAASGRMADLRIALDCYDRARESIDPDLSNPVALQTLALAWLNRGNILQQMGPLHYPGAHDAYDAASAALSSLELTPERRLNHGALWTNRGQLLIREHQTLAARHAFNRALALLEPALDDARHGAIARRNAAGAAIDLVQTYLNQADEHHDLSSTIEPLLANAVAWLVPIQATDAIAATLALEAARIDLLLREPRLDADTFGEFTDQLEAALALATAWLHRGHPTARLLAASLFQLGAEAYGRHQPHFLLEFLRDALDPASGPAPFAAETDFHFIADRALARVRADLARPRALNVDEASAHHLLALQHELQVTPAWLRPSPTSDSRSIA